MATTQVARRRYNETVALTFPLADLNGVVANSLTPVNGGQPLIIGDEGDYLCYGISATACKSSTNGLPDNTNLQIQIRDIGNKADWFSQAQGYALLGVPLEHVAGKAGNPPYTPYARVIPAGSRLMLYMSHSAASTPTGRSPVYVTLWCVLVKKGDPRQTQLSLAAQMKARKGTPDAITVQFPFSTTNLAPGGSRLLQAPLNANEGFLIKSISCRLASQPVSYLDPRTQEQEILISLADSVSLERFNQPDNIPLWLAAGHLGARELRLPTGFYINANANIVVNLFNQTGDAATPLTLNTDLFLTFRGLRLNTDPGVNL